MSAAELRAAVSGVPDRTLRNWLAALVRSGDIESRGERKGRRYRSRPRGPIVGIAASGNTWYGQLSDKIFSEESEALLRRIEAPIYARAPATYHGQWLAAYVPNESAYLSVSQRESLNTLGKRDPIFRQAGTYIRKIYDRLLERHRRWQRAG